jgi:hypothetical protein
MCVAHGSPQSTEVNSGLSHRSASLVVLTNFIGCVAGVEWVGEGDDLSGVMAQVFAKLGDVANLAPVDRGRGYLPSRNNPSARKSWKTGGKRYPARWPTWNRYLLVAAADSISWASLVKRGLLSTSD